MAPRKHWLAILGLGLLALGLYLLAWPAVWRLVILPSAGERPGLAAEVFAGPQPKGKSAASARVETAAFPLDQANATARLRGLWRPVQAGLWRLRLQADDSGRLLLDRREVLALGGGPHAHNQGETELNLDAGPHLIQIDLINLQGAGWVRLLAQGPGQDDFQPLALGLAPVDLGNLSTWLALVDGLERAGPWLVLWSLLALAGTGLAGWLSADHAARVRMAWAAWVLLAGWSLTLVAARLLPSDLGPSPLGPYGDFNRLQTLGALGGLTLLAAGALATGPGWGRGWPWLLGAAGLLLSRVLAWPYSITTGIHPDYGSFWEYFGKFHQLYYQQGLDQLCSPPRLAAYLGEVWRNLHAGYPAGLIPFASLGIGGLAWLGFLALPSGDRAASYLACAHLSGPLFNLALAWGLMLLARRHFLAATHPAWSWLVLAGLVCLPVHVYLGGNVSYNLLADALHLGLFLCGLSLLERWRAWTGPSAEASAPPRAWPLLRGPALGLALFLAAALGAKIVFLPGLATLLVGAAALALTARGLDWRRRVVLPLALLGSLAAGLGLYLLLIAKNLANVPGFLAMLRGMVAENASPPRLGFWERLDLLVTGVLLPNLGGLLSLAGILGLVIYVWRALGSRQTAPRLIALWLAFNLALNLLSWNLLASFNALTRSTLLPALWLVLAVYFLASAAHWLGQRWGRVARSMAMALVLAAGLELVAAGSGLLGLYAAGSPRWRAEQALSRELAPDSVVAYFNYLYYLDEPNSRLGRVLAPLDLHVKLKHLRTLDQCRALLAANRAPAWLLTSYDPFFAVDNPAAPELMAQVLAEAGYTRRRLEAPPGWGPAGWRALQARALERLLSTSLRGGLLEPLWVDLHQRPRSLPEPNRDTARSPLGVLQ